MGSDDEKNGGMNMDIAGKIVLITGASEGIGMETAKAFASRGAKVALAARSEEKLEGVAREIRERGGEALVVPTDMRDQDQIRRMVQTTEGQFGRVDVLVNNAGQAASGKVEEIDDEAFHKIIELNMFGPLYAMQAVIPGMKQRGGGIILNISSQVSWMHIPSLAAYASTKAALNMLSKTARQELEGDNIRVILVYPRLTETNFGKNTLGNQEERQRQRRGQAQERKADSASFVAEKIVQAAINEPEEQFMDR
jgi:short-subunit dehydrogenase